MPKLWSETIDSHRHAVRETILDTAGVLISQHGLASVTMSQLATESGIGRATLYKYFADVEAVLIAWHERHVARHIEQLKGLGQRSGDPAARLKTVLEAYAMISYHREQPGAELAAAMHRGNQIAAAQQRLLDLVRSLLDDVAASDNLRQDIPTAELAAYCLHALTAAATLPSEAAVRRLVRVTLTGLRPTAAAEPRLVEPPQ